VLQQPGRHTGKTIAPIIGSNALGRLGAGVRLLSAAPALRKQSHHFRPYACQSSADEYQKAHLKCEFGELYPDPFGIRLIHFPIQKSDSKTTESD
jgi:hypothetical protein